MFDITIERNKSSTYFLPLINRFVPVEYFYLLRNTYFWYDDDMSQDVFVLLYEFDGRVFGKLPNRGGFTVYEQELRENNYYVGEIDYGKYVIYVFKIPDELLEARLTLIDGKYSRLSRDDKNTILEYIKIKYNNATFMAIKEVLYREASLRNRLSEELRVKIKETAELSSPIDLDKETFSNYVEQTKKIINNEGKIQAPEGWNPWRISAKESN